jgi:uncharacterized protein YjiK
MTGSRTCRSMRTTIAGLAAVLTVGAVAEAHAAIFLARRVVGRVEQMSQQSQQPNGAGYDSAAVMLEAPAQKVFSTAVSALQRAKDQGIIVTRVDNGELLVQFTNGQQIAGMKVSALGDRLSHMLITSAHSGSQPNAAALVSDSVLRVCREMNVECSRAR